MKFKDTTSWSLFLLVSVFGGLGLTLAFVLGSQTAQLATLGGYLAVLIAMAWIVVDRARATNELIREIGNRLEEVNRGREVDQLSVRLSRDPQVRSFYAETIDALESVFSTTDHIFLNLANEEINHFLHSLKNVWSAQSLCYRGELWRRPYKTILQQTDVIEYLSVAWLKSESYWRDEPGQESLKLNYDLAETKRIHRLFIVRDSIWDSNHVKALVKTHIKNGMKVSLVRESSLPPELRDDMGIYGHRAVGYQKTNDACQTQEFVLYFDQRAINIARRRFEELEGYAIAEDQLKSYLGEETT